MRNLIPVTNNELVYICGGKDEYVTKLVYNISRGLSRVAKFLFINVRESNRIIGWRIAHGDMGVWK